MGMFDSVYAPCAHCGSEIEYQSKAGECCMDRYTVETAPVEVLIDILNEPHYCAGCGRWTALFDPRFTPTPPRPEPRSVKVREPSPEETRIHSSHTYLRWWQAPFSEADIVETEKP